MKITTWVTFIYGLLILIGGIMGHVKAASRASLITGVGAGLVLLLCSLGMFKNKISALYAAAVATLCLEVFFIYRYAHTLKFFPPGFLSIISLAVLIFLGLKIKSRL